MMTNDMTHEQIQTAAIARRERLLRFHLERLKELQEAAPTWVEAADECDPFDPQACELLAETSPDDSYLRGYYFGKAAILHEIQGLTALIADC